MPEEPPPSFEELHAVAARTLRSALSDRMTADDADQEAVDVVIAVMERLRDRADAGDPVDNPVGYAVAAARHRAADVRRGAIRETRDEPAVRVRLAEDADGTTVAGANGSTLDAAADALGLDRGEVRAMAAVARDRAALYAPDDLDADDGPGAAPTADAGAVDWPDAPPYRVASATLDLEGAMVDGYPVSGVSVYLELWRRGRLTLDPVGVPWLDGVTYPRPRRRHGRSREVWRHLAEDAPGLRQWALTEWIAYPTAKTMLERYVARLAHLHLEWSGSSAVEREDLEREWQALVVAAGTSVAARGPRPEPTTRLADFEPPPEWDVPLTARLRGAKLHFVVGGTRPYGRSGEGS